MSKTLAAAAILNDVAQLGADLLARPLIVDITPWRKRCEDLQARIEAEISSSAFAGRYLDNFAPLMLQAIDRALYRRHLTDEPGAVKWDSVVGSLLPHVRADAGDALDSMRRAD
jgi:hypothetical protein